VTDCEHYEIYEIEDKKLENIKVETIIAALDKKDSKNINLTITVLTKENPVINTTPNETAKSNNEDVQKILKV